jgi:hypothetical protein
MKSIVFTFDEKVPEANQDRLGDEISKSPGVSNVGRISPEATKPALRRLWYAEVGDDTAASKLLERLRQHDDVRSADIPADRGLV